MTGAESQESEHTYTLAQLSDLTELPPRKVRYYQTRQLLPASTEKGKSKYDDQYLATLLVVKALREEGLSLKAIKEYVGATESGEDEEAPGAGVVAELRERLKASAGRLHPERVREMTSSILGVGPSLISKVLGAFKKAPASPLSPSAQNASPAAQGPQRSHWERIVVSNLLELHVRRPLSAEQNKDLATLLEAAQELFGESPD